MKGHVLALCLMLAAGPALAQGRATAKAEIKDRDGKALGTVTLSQMPMGVWLRVELTGIEPGWHGIHLHRAGVCEAPFQSAGGHLNPDDQHKHGWGEHGPHPGDLTNIFATEQHKVSADLFTDKVTLTDTKSPTYLFDRDGTSIVLHAKSDDYTTDPAGDSGERIACGVIKKG